MLTSAIEPQPSSKPRRIWWMSACIYSAAILAPTYNGLFAILNAHGLRASRVGVIAAEMSILALCLFACAAGGRNYRDIGPIALMFVSCTIAVAMSLVSDTIFPDLIRNIAIICCFTALGFRVSERHIALIFRVVSLAVAFFLVLELFSLKAYVWVFQPAQYLEASRGIQQFELNDTGLFANALGFQDRFNFGIFSGPRTSSLFLEQVSLPGYATVALLYVSTKWKNLGTWDRVLQIGLIVLIVLSNNSRTSAALLLVIGAGFFVFPYIPSRLSLLLPIGCVGAAFLLVGPVDTPLGSDDLSGRLSVTVADLVRSDVSTFLFGSIQRAYHSFDSGYVYVLVSSTMWGCMALWCYITVVPGHVSPEQRRLHWGLALYVYTWLLIGGTAVFTMKTASLLWLLVGQVACASTVGLAHRRAGAISSHVAVG